MERLSCANLSTSGVSAVCTIHFDVVGENPGKAITEMITKDGYDPDEWRTAMCVDRDEGADVAYVDY